MPIYAHTSYALCFNVLLRRHPSLCKRLVQDTPHTTLLRDQALLQCILGFGQTLFWEARYARGAEGSRRASQQHSRTTDNSTV